jgi:hypothetical protein
MEVDQEIAELVRLGLEHYVENRDKGAAIRMATERLENIGLLDILRDQLSVSIDQFKVDEDDSPAAFDLVMSRSLIDRIGYEATEKDIDARPSRSGADCLEAPDPVL